MIPSFRLVVDYRMYPASIPNDKDLNGMYILKRRIDSLYTTLGTFSGEEPMELLNFISMFKEAMDSLGKCEGIAVRVLAYYLTDDARTAYENQVTPGTVISDSGLNSTWPHVVHMFLVRYLTDEILQKAYDSVARATMKPDEDELQFAQRIMTNSRKCRNVFTPSELVQSYIMGLPESIRHRMHSQMYSMSPADKSNMVVIRNLAYQEGQSQRAMSRPTRQAHITPKPPKPLAKAVNLHIGAPDKTDAESTYTWETALTSGKKSALDPSTVVNTAMALENIFIQTNEDLERMTKLMSSDERDVMRPTEDVPNLTDEQVRLGQSAIPNDYWQLNCWSCRDQGHSTFTCPFLSPAQRVYFAYKYYLYQIKSNPNMRNWYQQKSEAMRRLGPDPGPRPPMRDNDVRGRFGFGRGGGRPVGNRQEPRREPAQSSAPAPQQPGAVHVMGNPSREEVSPPTEASTEN